MHLRPSSLDSCPTPASRHPHRAAAAPQSLPADPAKPEPPRSSAPFLRTYGISRSEDSAPGPRTRGPLDTSPPAPVRSIRTTRSGSPRAPAVWAPDPLHSLALLAPPPDRGPYPEPSETPPSCAVRCCLLWPSDHPRRSIHMPLIKTSPA